MTNDVVEIKMEKPPFWRALGANIAPFLTKPLFSRNGRQSAGEKAKLSKGKFKTLYRESERSIGEGSSDPNTWSSMKLRQMLDTEFSDAELIVVSNREPYAHETRDGEIELETPASGLVSALEPIVKSSSGTWIAHGSGSADRNTVDANDRIAVTPDNPAYTLRRVWLSDEEHKGYYIGAANEGLWPLCHIAFTRPIFRAADWECYRAVNQKFADAVLEEAQTDSPIILVQDYHLALLPRLLRQRLPRAIIITFWHIPWPNAEIFNVCPWREEIIDGLLGSSILGFHIQAFCSNFLDGVDRCVESRIDRQNGVVFHRGEPTTVNAYPISIEWPAVTGQGEIVAATARNSVLRRFNLPADIKMAVGVDRLDYTKGILDRFQALDEFFQQHSDWIGCVTFLQIAVPSRSELNAYQALHKECASLAETINERYGTAVYRPIVMLNRYHDKAELDELYRAADLCVVSSLHDGMNLVAKEFVAAREDESGVLVLSELAGASRELTEAIIVNPYNPNAMGEAFFQALTMPVTERRARMRRLREIVESNNVYRWAGTMLLDAARLRRDNLMREMVDENSAEAQFKSTPEPVADAGTWRYLA